LSETPIAKPRLASPADSSIPTTEERLRNQNRVLVELARRKSIHSGDLALALREITEAAASTLDVDRVGIWFYTEDRKAIVCEDLYERTAHRHSSGLRLEASDYPVYFKALESERIISAGEARIDSRTAAFRESYLDVHGISSLLDAPIRRLGQMAGIVCHEQVGASRSWTLEEENFAGSIADLVSMAIDASERRQTQDSLRFRAEFEKLIARISTHFINLQGGDIDVAVCDALESVGKFVGADTAHVVMIDPGGVTASMTHEWNAPGITPRRDVVKAMPMAAFPWYMSKLVALENIYIRSLDEFPPEASPERAHHERVGNRSILAVPMIFNHTLLGYVGCNSTREDAQWSEDVPALLRLVGEIFLSALQRNRTERELRHSEERHRLLFERNLAGVYRNTVSGTMLECNEALARMLGFSSKAEFLQLRAGALYFDPKERERFIERVRRERSVSSLEVCLQKRDGSPVWLLESVHLTEEDGEEILEGTVIDITDRKLAETALRGSELRYRTLIEQMREGVVHIDAEGVIRYVNDRYCEMLGYERDELLGVRAETLVTAEADRALLHSRYVTGGSSTEHYELQFRRKDGRTIWVDIGSAPLIDAAGTVIGTIGVHNDITERRAAEAALRESEARYRLMAENSTDLISRTTTSGVILYVSDAVRTLLGYEPQELLGRSILSYIHEDDHEVVRYATRSVHVTPMTFSYRVRMKSGKVLWFETTCRGVVGADGQPSDELVSVSRDVSERKRAEEQIEHQAYHDALTGLPNRLLFRDRLTVALASARRLKKPLAVMFLDLDRFKYVNDTLGHSLGDELLKVVADRLRLALREEDSIARMGGDEFTVLLADLATPDDAAKIAIKLLEAVAEPVSVEGHELFVTGSVGIALFPNDGDTAEMLLKNADHAMYRAKESGMNSYQLCTPSMNSRALERLSLENAMRWALSRGEFEVHYQPQLAVKSRKTTGMEALIRWNRPGTGLTSPATFIPIAEETRLIVPIGEWVLHEACRQAKEWQAGRFPGMRIAVNLSPRQFQHADLRRMISSALDASGLDPESLEIEITETTAMQNTARTIATLRELRTMGVRIAIDDFGTGHSSLSYLRNFPIDRVKIDQSFIHEVEESRRDRAIVAAVIEMTRGLDLAVTAEGVETEGQFEFLAREGCDEVQGYLFGRPVAPAAYA
jgi:diguanylate cyclase (GGDEF)-like protein/PAS domain S-box-containing protein